MLVTRKSILTGVVRILKLDITKEQYEAWQRGELIQNVMPHLSDADREFLISGVTQEECNDAFPD